jgi:carbon storage regulator
MLVLSRKPGESIVVGNDVTVTILEVRGDLVRVGIDAPRSVAVHRKEVHDELTKANRDAAESAGTVRATLDRLPQPPRRS